MVSVSVSVACVWMRALLWLLQPVREWSARLVSGCRLLSLWWPIAGGPSLAVGCADRQLRERTRGGRSATWRRRADWGEDGMAAARATKARRQKKKQRVQRAKADTWQNMSCITNRNQQDRVLIIVVNLDAQYLTRLCDSNFSPSKPVSSTLGMLCDE
jgi:hypothetical protein